MEKLALCCLDNQEGESGGYGKKLTASGEFSMSSVYHELTKYFGDVQESLWWKIWKIKAPMKMVVFLWLVRHGRIMCNTKRRRQGFITHDVCPQCGR